MPVVDKPLRDLVNYTTSNPRPADFDAFWAKGLAEMDALDPQVTFKDVDFPVSYASCQSMHFTGTGGSRVHARLVTPKTLPKEPGPALLIFHGYSGSSPDWVSMLPFVAAGYTVAALDCRGQGGLSEDTVSTRGNTLHGHIIKGLDDEPEKMYYRNVFLDTALLAKIVMGFEWVDETRVGSNGGSQGGALSLVCASLVPSLKRCWATFPFLCDYRRVWEMALDQRAYSGLRDYFRRFDPCHEREQEIFEKLGYIDVTHLAPRIKAEVTMAISQSDDVCPPSTQFAAYNAITSDKSYVLYPDFGHENLPGANEKAFQFLMGL
ncbi:acetylxylan esterase [Ruficoccus sp. ZRK36]|uniref:acetylxylan esterase n=1 Tax=Ruficoccus sp. ZRK36 TaxID=2866311 RepID=UPI001C734ACE|nr:acetylxylan esterase [Ruficoccus sp. ZRK36]QYY36273.1 acetylxylan esterase [Ruficoccus sp. ZRK36]